MTEEAPAARGAMLRPLASRNFLPYFLGASLSNIGTWFQNIAAGLLVYELTRSTLAVGAVNFAQFVGAFVLAPLAGGAADRFDRRRLLIVTQVGAAAVAAVLALLTLTGAVTAPVVIGLALLLGIALAFMVPALLAMVPLLVPRRDLDAAIALNSITFNLARAVGPVLGALVVEQYGYGLAFGLNAASFLAFVGALLVLRPRRQDRASGDRPRLIDSIRDVRAEPVWVILLLCVAAISATTDPINTLAPELAKDVFGGTDLDAGKLVGAFGAGATFTAVTLTGWLRGRRHTLVGAMTVQAAGLLLLAVAPTLEIGMVGMAVSGGGFIAALTRATTRLQTEVPDVKLGRVMALWSVCFLGTRPFAALLDGAAAELLGARGAAVVMAAPALLGAAVAQRFIRRRRNGPPPPPSPGADPAGQRARADGDPAAG